MVGKSVASALHEGCSSKLEPTLKIAVIVFQCLAGQAPSYLSDDCQPVSAERRYNIYICVSKKVPILTDFHNFCTAGKRMKFALKPIQHYPPHLRHVSTLPWEIKKSVFLQIFTRYGRKCKQILIFSVFKTASISPYWLQI